MTWQVRAETADDRAAVFEVNTAAFPTDAEAKLVDVLRDVAGHYVSLVATDDEAVVGHIMFTPVKLDDCPELRLMGLGPMAVAPAAQHCGIGSKLVTAGLERCRELGTDAVVVLGHPEFYPRFGFLPSARRDIRSEYDVPADVFMLHELCPGALENRHGIIRYHPAFAGM